MLTPVPNARRMSIANIVRGPVAKPLRLLLYGVDGIGKSTFAASSRAPVFIGTEDGTATLDVPRYPEPESWLDVMAALNDLATSEHSFETVVIDTLDWLEPLCWTHVCIGKRNKAGKPIEAIEDFDYGKGYTAALDEWRVLLSKLERLRNERGMTTVLIAHAWIKSFKNPEGEDFDRFEVKLHAKAGGLIREWVDAVLFATHEQHTYETKGTKRVKGISTGARILHTQRTAAFDAKNRHNLPEVLPLDWSELEEAILVGQPAPPDVLAARIRKQLDEGEAHSALRASVEAAVERAGFNASELARISNKLAARLNITKQENEQ